jgi:hypothetical protein
MSEQIARLIGSAAIVATLLMSGMRGVAPANAAQADDCLAAPNSTAPQGSRWYYRLDWTTQRKCWYVRAPGQPVQQAAPPTMGRATPHSMPVPSEPKPAADGARMSASPGDTTPPSAHIETSAVKPTAAPISRATTDDTTSSIPEVSAPQASTFSEISAQTAAPAPNAEALAWPDTVPRIKAQGSVEVSTDASAASASDYIERIARSREQTKNAGMRMIIFLIIALGLAVVGILSRVVIKNIKNASARRARIVIDYLGPDTIDDMPQSGVLR